MAHHEDEELVAGDDWTIIGALTEDDGVTPLDLTTVHTIQWVLLGRNGRPVLPPDSAVLQIVDPPNLGGVAITIPASVTATIDPGRYIDALRVIMSPNVKATVWTGVVDVDANPFDVFDTPIGLYVNPQTVSSPEIGVGVIF